VPDPVSGPGSGPGVRTAPGLRRVAAFATTRFVTVSSPQQSADLIVSRQPSIVISSSGMATGAASCDLAATLSSTKNAVLFVGYQAAGTRGRLLPTARRRFKLLGRVYRSRRTSSASIPCRRTPIPPNHAMALGILPRAAHDLPRAWEPAAAQALAARITAERQWPVHIAAHLERVELPA